MHDTYSQTQFTFNPEGRSEVLSAWGVGARREPNGPVPGTEEEAEALRRQMAERAKAKRAAAEAASDAAD